MAAETFALPNKLFLNFNDIAVAQYRIVVDFMIHLMKSGTGKQLIILNTMRSIVIIENAPKAIFRQGFLRAFLNGASHDNLKTLLGGYVMFLNTYVKYFSGIT